MSDFPPLSAEAASYRRATPGFHIPTDADLAAAKGRQTVQPDEVLSPQDKFDAFVDQQVEAARQAYKETVDIVVGNTPDAYTADVRKVVAENAIAALVRDSMAAARDHLENGHNQ